MADPTSPASPVSRQDLIDFVVHEARLLDDRRYDDWNALFARDGWYWVPLSAEQDDPLNHASHLYEDRLLRDLRIERLKSGRAHSQRPPSRCHHLLQTPTVEHFEPATNRYATRTEFLYTEAQAGDLRFLVGTCLHHLALEEGRLRMTLKRVNLIHADAALPAVQLFL